MAKKVNVLQSEPVVSAGVILGVLSAVLAFAVAHGWITDTDASSFTQLMSVIVPFVLSVVTAFIARQHVTPLADPKITTASGAVVPLVPVSSHAPAVGLGNNAVAGPGAPAVLDE